MPIYEYRCQACGHEQEFLQKISDPVLSDCPECKKPSLKKKVSAAGFRLKGSGWYETDFKSGNKKNVAGSESAASTGSSDKGSKASSDSSTGAAAATSKSESSSKKSDSGSSGAQSST